MTTATYAPTAPISTIPPQLQPYGLGPELLRSLAANQQLGSQVGSTFGSLASLMPFGVSPVASQVTSPLHAQLAQQQIQLAQQQALLHQQAIAHQHAVAQHVLAQQALAQQVLAQQIPPYGHIMPYQNPYTQFGYWQN